MIRGIFVSMQMVVAEPGRDFATPYLQPQKGLIDWVSTISEVAGFTSEVV